MFRELLKGFKNKNIVYYIIIAVLVYLIYTEYQKQEGFNNLAPAPAISIPNMCKESKKKSRPGCLILMSSNGLYKLDIDNLSGNLQIVNINTNSNVWRNKNKRNGKGPFRLVMQDDRNLVVYDSNNEAIWASNTVLRDKKQYKGLYKAILEDDGVLRIRDNMNLLVWESSKEQQIVYNNMLSGVLLNDVKNIPQSELDMYKNDEYRTIEDLFRTMLSAKLSRNIDLFKKLKKTSKIGAGILSKLDEMKRYWGPVNYIENRKRLEDGLRKMGLYGKRGFEKVPYLKSNFVAPKIFDKSWIDKYYYSVDNLYKKNDKQLNKNVPYLPILIHIKKKDVSLEPYQGIPLSEFDVQYINEDKYVKRTGNDLELMGVGELNYYYYIIGLYAIKDINILKDLENNSTKQLLQKIAFDQENIYWTNDVYKENEKRLNDILNALGAI
jgi:hypothetical protein